MPRVPHANARYSQKQVYATPQSSASSIPKTSISVLMILSNSSLPMPTLLAKRYMLFISVLMNCLTPTSALVMSSAPLSSLSTLLAGLVGRGASSSAFSFCNTLLNSLLEEVYIGGAGFVLGSPAGCVGTYLCSLSSPPRRVEFAVSGVSSSGSWSSSAGCTSSA